MSNQARTAFPALRLLLACTVLAGCSPTVIEPAPAPASLPAPPTESATGRATVVEEGFISDLREEDNIDSPAAWRGPDGSTWVIATAKATDQLVVYDGDTGATLQRVGQRGDAPGDFKRPNGVFVLDDLLLVVERDGRRIQALQLPTFSPLLAFGETSLIKPYGLWARRGEMGIDIYVTDAYMAGEDEQGEDILPPLAELDRRVKQFSLRIEDASAQAELVAAHGDISPEGALRVVESIWGDPTHDRLLIAEEDESYANEIKVYRLDGRYAGSRFGRDRLAAQAEGIALYACADGSGYWLTTEQGKERSVFHLFDRQTLEYIGAFSGETVANTDGIWLHQAGTRRFPAGALYAVHDDQGLVGFDWRDIAVALSLRTCGPG